MSVRKIFTEEGREEFDDWLFEPIELTPKKPKTPQEEFEIAMARYELGLGPLPTPVTRVAEGEVIEVGRTR